MLRRIREIKNNESGFTLIELLIVIVILGVLAAVVVFAVGAFNKNGVQAACRTDYKTVEIADEAYYAQHNSAYAPVATTAQALVTAGYLKAIPSNSAYTIGLGTAGPVLTLTGPPVTGPFSDVSGCDGLAPAGS
jgi:prepilin-type N-terminal cleavage/methylation domain-containing protein